MVTVLVGKENAFQVDSNEEGKLLFKGRETEGAFLGVCGWYMVAGQ